MKHLLSALLLVTAVAVSRRESGTSARHARETVAAKDAEQAAAAEAAKPAAKSQGKAAKARMIEAVRVDAKAAAEGWVELFDGESLFGWSAEAGSEWRAGQGTLEAVKPGWLVTNAKFADFRLRLQYRLKTDAAQAAVILRTTGDVVAKDSGVLAPLKGEGGWHEADFAARGSQFVVRIDGMAVKSVRDFRFQGGHIALSGTGVEFRSIRLRPLDLGCLFNGKDLTGWRVVEPEPAAAQPAEWSVLEGAIHVEKGPGQLETTKTYRNFLLQVDVRTNTGESGRHPDAGVFLRGDRGLFWSGYESQIRNEYRGEDAAGVVDYGTGGVYGRQAARKIVARDNEWFTKTMVVSGRTISVWVDGVPVTSWTDGRAEGLSVKAGQARLLRGTIGLQAHDAGTNVDFRNLCIGEVR